MLLHMGKKGKKSTAGQAETQWGEPKSKRLMPSITATAKRIILEIVKSFGIPQSEFFERLARQWHLIMAALRSTPSIATLIALEAINRGWSPQQLAEEIDLSLEEIDALVAGAKPTDDQVFALASVLTKPSGELWSVAELCQLASRNCHSMNGGT